MSSADLRAAADWILWDSSDRCCEPVDYGGWLCLAEVKTLDSGLLLLLQLNCAVADENYAYAADTFPVSMKRRYWLNASWTQHTAQCDAVWIISLHVCLLLVVWSSCPSQWRDVAKPPCHRSRNRSMNDPFTFSRQSLSFRMTKQQKL